MFQLVSHRFDLAEHRLDNTNNIVVITRLLQQIGLDTRRYVWTHDANAESGDKMMVGVVRIPTHSWFLWTLALLEITHYIWIKDDGLELVFVGPSSVEEILLRIANQTNTRQANDAELEEIQKAVLGRRAQESSCLCWERVIASLGLGALLVYLVHASPSKAMHVIAFICCGCLLSTAVLHRMRQPLQRCMHRLRAHSISWQRLRNHTRIGGNADPRALLPACVVELVEAEEGQAKPEGEDSVHLENAHQVSLEDAPNLVENLGVQTLVQNLQHQGPTTCSMVTVRHTWFEVGANKVVEDAHHQDIAVPETCVPVIYAISIAHALPLCIAARVKREHGCVPYICPHNPMSDVPVFDMTALIQKSSLTVMLVLILPPAEAMDEALANSTARMHGLKETRYLHQAVDWIPWLFKLASGVVCSRIAVVLPFMDESLLTETRLWRDAVEAGMGPRILRSPT